MARQKRYLEWPAEERNMFQKVFERHACKNDDGELVLNAVAAGSALADCGVLGIEAAERRELWSIIQEKCDDGNIRDACEFAVEIFSLCRRAMSKYRLQNFNEALAMCNRDWEGRILHEQLLCAVKLVLPRELLDPDDESELTLDILQQVDQDHLASWRNALGSRRSNSGRIASVRGKSRKNTS